MNLIAPRDGIFNFNIKRLVTSSPLVKFMECRDVNELT